MPPASRVLGQSMTDFPLTLADNATEILVAVGQDLALLDVRTQAYQPLLSTETKPRALVYDLLRETYYWLTEDGELRVHHPGKGTQPLYTGEEDEVCHVL